MLVQVDNQSFLDLARQLMPLRQHWKGADVNVSDLPCGIVARRKFENALYAFFGLFRDSNITTDFFEEKTLNFRQLHRSFGPSMSGLASIDVLRLSVEPQIVIDWLYSPCRNGERTLIIEHGNRELYPFLILLDRAFRRLSHPMEHAFTVLINSHFTLSSWNLQPHQIARLFALQGSSTHRLRYARCLFECGNAFGRSVRYSVRPSI